MKVGTAQVNITPRPGIELSGFAVRAQPCTRVLDSLWVRVLYVEAGAEKLLWIHGDVLAFEEKTVERLRAWIREELAIPATQVVIAATHTHSGPATIQLTGCGQVDAGYVRWLEAEIRTAVLAAVKEVEPCSFVSVEGQCQLAIDRLNPAVQTDPTVAALGWRRSDGSYKAVILSYAMHPVCLRDSAASGDWPGEAARFLTTALPGLPTVMVSSGACGNINPPQVGVTAEQTYQWGRQVAQSVLPGLLEAPMEKLADGLFKMTTLKVDLPLESWTPSGIEKYAAESLADAAGQREFGAQFSQAIAAWRTGMLRRFERHEPASTQAELGILSLGRVTLLTVNAEVFSRFTELTNLKAEGPVYTIGCANGMIGYLPSAEAYLETGYEVSWSMFFYDKPRLRKGGLELLADRVRQDLGEPSKVIIQS